jgi:hypothetical protein
MKDCMKSEIRTGAISGVISGVISVGVWWLLIVMLTWCTMTNRPNNTTSTEEVTSWSSQRGDTMGQESWWLIQYSITTSDRVENTTLSQQNEEPSNQEVPRINVPNPPLQNPYPYNTWTNQDDPEILEILNILDELSQ